MNHQVVLIRPQPLPASRRLAATVAIVAARLVLATARGRPARIRRTLSWCLRGAVPAGHETTLSAHTAVTTVNLWCASPHGCLLRSVAVVLLCRLSSERPRWVVGFSSPPPASHAWVETIEGPVGEPVDPRDHYTPAITLSEEAGTHT